MCASRRVLLLSVGLALLAHVPARGQDLPDLTKLPPINPKAEAAIKKALDFLKTKQRPDGAWEASFGEATSISSLAVMSYLACGHEPGTPGPYRETIEKGIRFVLKSQKPNGLLVARTANGPMYCHGISTLMLAEVVGMTTDPALASECRAALVKAVELILKAQDIKKDANQTGGWRYQPTSADSDISVTGWQIMALCAAKSVGCAVPAENIDRAVAFLKRCAVKNGGGFAYQPGGAPNNSRTGVGMLALELCGTHHTPEALAGSEYLRKHPPKWAEQYFFYEVYYVPQALFQVGDEAFRDYYPRLVLILLEHQDADGSWLSGDGNDRTGGHNYCTAMAVLALAVEYRYLPIYQR